MLVSADCLQCGTRFTYDKVGQGRIRGYCSGACKLDAHNAKQRLKRSQLTPNQRDALDRRNGMKLTCAVCGSPMWKSATSRQQGQAVHNSCRRTVSAEERKQAQAWLPNLRAAVPRQRKPRPPLAKTSERGYGTAHQNARTKLLAQLVAGTPCGFCSEPMEPGQPLDLDHSDPSSRLRGEPGDRLTHRSCNRARKGNRHPRVQSCEICGDEFPYRERVRTCGRKCGWELRRRNNDLKEVS